ncbi:MAG: ABC transporter ATP-binding protein [Acidobacteriota bacterium]
MLEVDNIHKSFTLGGETVEVLRGVTFQLQAGEALAVIGPSGSGKSTLLHLLGTLDQPTAGSFRLDGDDPSKLSEPQLARFRNQRIGFIFQEHRLLPQYSVLENVLLPTFAFPGDREGQLARARQLLDRVGLSPRLNHRPAELSGGERQRVAVARALIQKPRLLLCDEPTGSLDGATATAVADLLFELHREEDNVLVVVTHSRELAERCERTCRLTEGRCSAA